MDIATFGAGCFWCVEAVFQRLRGVDSVVSGYSGGEIENPSYDQVITGSTGHAEVCQIHFDPEQITFEALLVVFFNTHDPTTLNRQGNDVGTQYRSIIFCHSDEQKESAEMLKSQLDASGEWKNPIVTEITSFSKFFPAEDYHSDYYHQNQSQPYCRIVIKPKLDKVEQMFKLKLE
ncbi:MAG: peptide-methionine (S)-S-oxide reductase MsrA [Candidatus Thorarchaeota archaeon]